MTLTISKIEGIHTMGNILGQVGEVLACDYLRSKRYTILERNYRSPAGEIDIVAKRNGVLVFVEVKTCMSNAAGHPLEWIDANKERRIIQTAKWYMSERQPLYQACQYDVIGIVLREGEEAEYEHICCAFVNEARI